MKTFSLRKEDARHDWFIIDAQNIVLGRLAAIVATMIRGKHKPCYTPHVNCGDYIVIINAERVYLTGKKLQDKIYYRHTGYPGGIKSRTAKEIINGKYPERLIQKAVSRMLPKGPLGREVMSNLKVYAGTEHPHEAQQPEILDVAKMNPKNSKHKGIA